MKAETVEKHIKEGNFTDLEIAYMREKNVLVSNRTKYVEWLESELEKVTKLKNLCHEYNESFKVESTLSGIFIRSKMSFSHVSGANKIADLLNEIITKN